MNNKTKIEPTKEEVVEQSLVTAGQRRINILWEVTQSLSDETR